MANLNTLAQDYSGKTVMITGGRTGLGQAMTQGIVSRGGQVAYCSRRTQDNEAFDGTPRVVSKNDKTIAFQADISQATHLEFFFEHTKKHFGDIDLIICNAAISRDHLLATLPKSVWDEVIGINLTGAFLTAKTAHRLLKDQTSKTPHLLFISSLTHTGSPSNVSYASSKAGMIGLMQGIAESTPNHEMTVSAVSLGYIETALMAGLPEDAAQAIKSLTPLKRASTPEEMANMLLFMGRAPALYHGQCTQITAGIHDFPLVYPGLKVEIKRDRS